VSLTWINGMSASARKCPHFHGMSVLPSRAGMLGSSRGARSTMFVAVEVSFGRISVHPVCLLERKLRFAFGRHPGISSLTTSAGCRET